MKPFPKRPWKLPMRLVAWLALPLALGSAHAASLELSGNFTQDDQIKLISLVVSNANTLSVRSLGYAGGVDSTGNLHGGGGFDTMAFLYNDAGVLLAQSDDGIGVATDPVTGLAADAAFSIALSAGQYFLALTQYDNFALGNLSAGFSRAGAGNFTPTLSPTCSATSFCDWSGAARTGHWVLDITGVAAAVPEPGSFAMTLIGVAALVMWRRRQLANIALQA